jgi:hypothetical protein
VVGSAGVLCGDDHWLCVYAKGDWVQVTRDKYR